MQNKISEAIQKELNIPVVDDEPEQAIQKQPLAMEIIRNVEECARLRSMISGWILSPGTLDVDQLRKILKFVHSVAEDTENEEPDEELEVMRKESIQMINECKNVTVMRKIHTFTGTWKKFLDEGWTEQ